ncbi:MAG: dihydromethanopterin reductase (acceptor) [Candidatus Hydrothermarchaeales archaeon]
MNIAWGITGAGHLIKESFDIMEEVAKEHKVTTFLSKSAEEVIKAYGLWEKLQKISPGDYLEEIVTPEKQGASAPTTGRFFLGRYDTLIVSPTTTNTVAKIVNGISDTLVTNAVSHATKSMVQVYLVPVDKVEKIIETTLPYYIDKELCARCSPCVAADNCDQNAISHYSIDLLKCNACGRCMEFCTYGSIIGGKKLKMKVRKIDAENVKKLRQMEFIEVMDHPREILSKL